MKRIERPAAPAHQAGAADDDGGDDVELGADADLGRADAGAAGRDDPGARRPACPRSHRPRYDVARHRDAREPYGLLVRADRLDETAEAGEVSTMPPTMKTAQHRARRATGTPTRSPSRSRRALALVAHPDRPCPAETISDSAARDRHHRERVTKGGSRMKATSSPERRPQRPAPDQRREPHGAVSAAP